jgi:transcriptional regulator with XRE-family HTH domain
MAKRTAVKKDVRIGDVIKRARTRKKLKAEQVGALCNVSRTCVYQWEEADFIKPKNFKNLSAALGISVERLAQVNGKRELDPVA